MPSKITLTFVNTTVLYDGINILVDTGAGTQSLSEYFTPTRWQSGQVTADPSINQIGGTVTSTTAELAQYFVEAWNLDYKNTGGTNNMPASIGANSNKVDIVVNNPAWQFQNPTGVLINEGDITYVVANETVAPAYTLNFDGYSSGDCTTLNADFTATGGTGSYKVYINNALTLDGVASPFTVGMTRGKVETVYVNDTNNQAIGSQPLNAPRKLLSEDIRARVDNLDAGATIVVEILLIGSAIRPFEYSLDGITYRPENVFTGIANGNYTLYVKDAFGCVSTKAIVVDGVTSLVETVFGISNLNPLRFAKVESGKKNIENTLSCNELKNVAYPYYHKYRDSDVITTQFRTNAQYINTYAIDSEGTQTPLTAVKRTENIGITVKSTATLFDTGYGKTGLYFGVVDMLDPLDDSILETVDYGFALPEWAKTEGKYVSIEGLGAVKIDAVEYSDTYASFVLIFNITPSVAEATKKVTTTYNRQPYEIYEIDKAVSSLPDLCHIVVEVGADAENISHTVISEKIRKVEDSDRLVEVVYWDTRNKGDMNYQTGVKHTLLLEGYSDYIGEQETEGYNGDADYYVTDNQVFETERFVFDRLSSAMAHKLRLVFAHSSLTVNGLTYKIGENPEINTNINNNFKTFSVLLKRGGNQFLDISEEIIDTVGLGESEIVSGAIEASQGNALILWTKQNA